MAHMSRELIESGLHWKYDVPRVSRLLAEPETLALVACDRIGLCGFGVMHFGDERAHLLLLAVRSRSQRQGIGRRMLEWLTRSAASAGMAELSLELRAGNTAARAFYRSLGYTETAVVPGYYQNRESAIRMLRVLRANRTWPLAWQAPTLRRP